MARPRRSQQAPAETAPGLHEAPAGPFHLTLDVRPDGRVLIPLEIRTLMKLGPDGRVNAELVDGELRLFSPAIALDRLDRLFAPLRTGPSVVDELLAERRAEAVRE